MKPKLYAAAIVLFIISCNKDQITNTISSSNVENSSTTTNGLVFIAKGYNFDSATLYALDIKTGIVKWQFVNNKRDAKLSYTPCVADNKLFTIVAQEEDRAVTSLFAFDAHTGRIVWKTILSHNAYTSIGNPTFEHGNVYVAAEKKLFSLDAVSGNIKWQIQLDSATSDNPLCSPTVQNGSIYIGNKKHFFLLDTLNGSIKWQVDANLYTSTPTVADGIISFINTTDGEIYAYDFKGRFQWKTNSKDYLSGSTTASQNVIYQYEPHPEKSINYFSLNSVNGSKAWQYNQLIQKNNQTNYIYGDPFYTENTLYITLADSLIAVDAKNQTKKWSLYTNAPAHVNYAHSSVIAGRGLVFDMALDNNLYALSAKDGKIIWKFSANDNYFSYSPVAMFNDGFAVHPTNSGMTQ